MEDEEGIGLILARATELRLKITDSIDSSSPAISGNDLSFPGEGKKDGTIGNQDKEFDSISSGDVEEEEEEEEADEQLLRIRDALESLESQLASLQVLKPCVYVFLSQLAKTRPKFVAFLVQNIDLVGIGFTVLILS